jgi:hypothetical protein
MRSKPKEARSLLLLHASDFIIWVLRLYSMRSNQSPFLAGIKIIKAKKVVWLPHLHRLTSHWNLTEATIAHNLLEVN